MRGFGGFFVRSDFLIGLTLFKVLVTFGQTLSFLRSRWGFLRLRWDFRSHLYFSWWLFHDRPKTFLGRQHFYSRSRSRQLFDIAGAFWITTTLFDHSARTFHSSLKAELFSFFGDFLTNPLKNQPFKNHNLSKPQKTTTSTPTYKKSQGDNPPHQLKLYNKINKKTLTPTPPYTPTLPSLFIPLQQTL